MNKQAIKLTLTLMILVLLEYALLCLGFWQLDRAEQKQQILAKQQANQSIMLQDLPDKANAQQFSTMQYQMLLIDGQFHADYSFFHDSQSHQGKAGYHVYTLFQTDTASFFVNRGWLLEPSLRSELPSMQTPQGSVKILGRINLQPEFNQFNSMVFEGVPTWPARVNRLDLHEIQKHLPMDVQKQFLPIIIELKPGHPAAFVKAWRQSSVSAEKHWAYAVQWFGLAITLLILVIIFWRKSSRNKQVVE